MKVYITYASEDIETAKELAETLFHFGHQILNWDSDESHPPLTESKILITEADAYIVIFSEDFTKSRSANSELSFIMGYARSRSKAVLPIKLDESHVPFFLNEYYHIVADRKNLHKTGVTLNAALIKLQGQKIAEQERKQERKTLIEKSAADFVQETLTVLDKREKALKTTASIWYIIGYASIIIGIASAVYLTLATVDYKSNWIDLVIWTFKASVVLVLLLSSSKYSFNLAKIYMNEAMKNADRTHAISFGKFYLQLYGNEVSPEDVKEVFRDWNRDQPSKFLSMSSNEYDPKIIELVTNILEISKPKKS